LAATAVSRADYFVSGDKGILALKRIGDTEIIQTSRLLKKLRI
jgi:predicted nucleic acid-binding protein